jgi:hypothetical protein
MLRHDHIVRLIAINTYEAPFFVALEYVPEVCVCVGYSLLACGLWLLACHSHIFLSFVHLSDFLQGSLLSYVRDKNPDTHTYGSPLKPAKLHLFSIQLASAMAYLERLRFVHNNLCCKHILVANEDQIKLSGFIQKIASPNETSASQTLGKDRYTPDVDISANLRWMVCVLREYCCILESRLGP